MKKVLSLVLAVMLTVGMTTVAFAALTKEEVTGNQAWGTITPGKAKNVVMTVGTAATAAVTPTFAVTAVSGPAGVTASDVEAFLAATVSEVAKDSKNVAVALANDGDVIAAGNYKITVTLDATGVVTFSNVNFTVAKTGTTVSTGNQVPTGWKITGFADDAAFVVSGDSLIGDATADQVSYLGITSDMFMWASNDGKTTGNAAACGIDGKTVRASQLKDIGIRRVYQKNAGTTTVRDVTLQDSDSRVRVRTVEFYQSTKSTDVELKLALTFKGSVSNAPEYEYSFTLANGKEYIEEGQNEVYSFGKKFLEADATVRDVAFIGDDDETVYATKTVVKGQKYYFNVTSTLDSDGEKIIAENPEVDSIYTVYSQNMANATVQFKDLDREYFVYDQDGKLLGTTKDKKLPLANKYILTTAKVDFGGEDEPVVDEPAEEPADVDAPPMGGGEVPPSNNYNPNTGL